VRYLLDTHTFLWLADDDPRLSAPARSIFVDTAHECFLSAASVWEMAIKLSLKKLALETSLEQLVKGGIERGVRLLDVASSHAYLVEQLPWHHRDPFDRLLIAPAAHEGMSLVSRDAIFDAYAAARVWE
jgi:PIN domain nuclease of toxin-antitoxin system